MKTFRRVLEMLLCMLLAVDVMQAISILAMAWMFDMVKDTQTMISYVISPILIVANTVGVFIIWLKTCR